MGRIIGWAEEVGWAELRRVPPLGRSWWDSPKLGPPYQITRPRSRPAKPAGKRGLQATEAPRCRRPPGAAFPQILPTRHVCREERRPVAKGESPGGRPTSAPRDPTLPRRSEIASTSYGLSAKAPTRSHLPAPTSGGIEARKTGSKIDRRSPAAGRRSFPYRGFPIASRSSIVLQLEQHLCSQGKPDENHQAADVLLAQAARGACTGVAAEDGPDGHQKSDRPDRPVPCK